MLSHVCGHSLGVARNVNPVLVRVPTLKNGIEYYMEGLRRVHDDIGDKKHAVVLLSLYWPRFVNNQPLWVNDQGQDGYDAIRKTFKDLISGIISKGATVVTGSGNGGLVSEMMRR
jgi:hypothetical protein